MNKKHKTITTWRQLIPPGLVLFVVLGLITSLFSKYVLFAYLSCMGLYFLTAIVAAIKAGASLSEIPKVIYAFLLLHFSYGIGYLAGIWDFVILDNQPSNSSAQMTR